MGSPRLVLVERQGHCFFSQSQPERCNLGSLECGESFKLLNPLDLDGFVESDSFPWPLEAPGVSSSTEHPRGWRRPWMSSAPRHTPGQNSLKEQEWLWNISPLQILNVGVASSSLHPSNRGMVFSRIHLQSRGMTVPGARHNSSPAAGRDKTSTAKTPPRFRALRRNHPRQLPGSSQGTRGLQELERDGGTRWERDPEGECG